MERRHFVTPGYDCRVECKHEKKGNHGIGSDEWVYVVSDGPRAVSLSMLSHDYPPTVDREAMGPAVRRILFDHRALIGTLHTHEAHPGGQPCEYVAGGHCKCDVTYLGAAEFWAAHGDSTQPEQGEAFWQALERELADRFEPTRPPEPSGRLME